MPLGVFVPGRDRTLQPWIAGAEETTAINAQSRCYDEQL
jgi:hypothetical protein